MLNLRPKDFFSARGTANTRSGEFGILPEDNEAELIQFDEFAFIDQGTFDDSVSWPEVFKYGDFYGQVLDPSDLLIRDSTSKNIFRSLFCLKSSFGLVPDGRKQYPTIFLRPDLEILSEIDCPFICPYLEEASNLCIRKTMVLLWSPLA